MASVCRYAAVRLKAGKIGKLVADAEGYYTMAIAGLNCLNSNNEMYVLEGSDELFKSSSSFMRRVGNGCLKGELGHPKFQTGMSDEAFINRILNIEETNWSVHFKEIWLDHEYGRKNPQFGNPLMVAVMAKLKPCGVRGPQLKESLENGPENVCFSIRALTRDYMHNGVNHRVLANIVTFDQVTEPGLALANKWDSPALETLQDTYISVRVLSDAVAKIMKSPVTMESNRMIALEALHSVSEKKIIKPAYLTW